MPDGIQIHSYDNPFTQPEGQTWNTTQLTEDFEVLGFAAPYVTVRRKADNVRGTLMFTHMPRIYYGFEAST
jgi:hypothetical protein